MLYLCEDLDFCTLDEREVLQTQVRKITFGICPRFTTLSNVIPNDNSSSLDLIFKPIIPTTTHYFIYGVYKRS